MGADGRSAIAPSGSVDTSVEADADRGPSEASTEGSPRPEKLCWDITTVPPAVLGWGSAGNATVAACAAARVPGTTVGTSPNDCLPSGNAAGDRNDGSGSP